jgi:hypothetical protein
LARDELLDVLVRAVVVGAIADGGLEPEGADPGFDEEVGAGLGRRIGAGRVVGGGLAEAVGVVELEVAENFVGRDVVEAAVVAADGFEQGEGADDIGGDERGRAGDGVVVVGFGGEMDDEVTGGDEAIDEGGVLDAAFDELDLINRGGKAGAAAGVGEGVEHGDFSVGSMPERVVDEIAADEASAAGD